MPSSSPSPQRPDWVQDLEREVERLHRVQVDLGREKQDLRNRLDESAEEVSQLRDTLTSVMSMLMHYLGH